MTNNFFKKTKVWKLNQIITTIIVIKFIQLMNTDYI